MTAGPKRKEAVKGDKNTVTIGGKNRKITPKVSKIPRMVEGNNFLYV